MIGLLLRLYPAAWRRRYGDEFAAILEERPLGPFDVADVLLGAVDAHLNLRGRWADAGHRRGFTMTLRIGGVAAILFGLLWALVGAVPIGLAGHHFSAYYVSFAAVGFAIGAGVWLSRWPALVTVPILIALTMLGVASNRIETFRREQVNERPGLSFVNTANM